MKEKRKLKRWLLSRYITVYANNSDKALGKIIDITTEGLRIVSNKQIPAYNEYKIKFETELTTAKTDWITVQVTSIWSKPDVNHHFYNTGFIFTDITPIIKLAIQDIIENLKFNTSD